MSTSTRETLPEIEAHVVAPTKELGGDFSVRRALPSLELRSIGPFVFFDEFGPEELGPGKGLDVRPHPHIGLATVTYLFEGSLLHRDSLGAVQSIEPGAVNWMTAGRGIVHSERTPPELRRTGSRLGGIQVWVGLPTKDEEAEPAFYHHPASTLPQLDAEGARVRVIAGSLLGGRSPVRTFSELFYAELRLEAGARFALPAGSEERGVYVVAGRLGFAGRSFGSGELLKLGVRGEAVLQAEGGPLHAMLCGGARLDGPRHVYWNFVSSSRERIEQAKEAWRAGRLGQVPEETEFIPLPVGPPPPVRYP